MENASRHAQCAACGGSGLAGVEGKTCAACSGTGLQVVVIPIPSPPSVTLTLSEFAQLMAGARGPVAT
jgi:RecJ-like exonuclease